MKEWKFLPVQTESGRRRQTSQSPLEAVLIEDYLLRSILRFWFSGLFVEIREFAEIILFGDTVEDKLVDPEVFTDRLRGAPQGIPDAPGRPASLAFPRGRKHAKVPFPGIHELDKPKVRGQVLHFFANHELLAMELMALLLLRFPDAPETFRAGIVETIREEQNHMRMYAERMNAAGVEFGEIPVNEFFWNVLRDVNSPMEFVTGMSMTLEQANLDYAGYYRKAFRAIGDAETADVLDIVYREEIGHVKHGVVWFDRWRPPGSDRFETWMDNLPERLPAVRAKGLGFDVESRVLAGLDDSFIRRLRVLGGSKGRPPKVFAFVPHVEPEVATNGTYSPSDIMRALQVDLETLPMFLGASDDVVLTQNEPDPAFLTQLGQVGFAIPQFVVGATLADAAKNIDYDRIGEFVPWGWSRSTLEVSSKIKASRVVDVPSVDPDDMRSRHTKSHWTPLRRDFLIAADDARLVSADQRLGGDCSDAELEKFLASQTEEPLCFRGDFGTAGRDMRRYFDHDELRTDWKRRREQGGTDGVLEPLRERVFDFSWQLEIERDGSIRHVGMVRTLVCRRGQFRGAIMNRFAAGLPTKLVRFIHGDGKDSRWLRRYMQRVAELVAADLISIGYRGFVGIDGFAFRGADGAFRVEPLAEVNPRVTMGRIALAMADGVSPAATAIWLMIPRRQLNEKLDGVRAFTSHLGQFAAREFSRDTTGKTTLTAGAIFTTDPSRTTQMDTLLMVSQNDEKAAELLATIDPDMARAMRGEGLGWNEMRNL